MVGFRTLNALPFQTGNTNIYNTFSGTGFRPLDGQILANYITAGPLSNFDTSIFEDYAPTYIPIPQHYYDPGKGIYEHDGKEIIDDTLTLEGPSFEDKSLGKGNYITATDILGPPPKEDYGHPGVSDTQKSSGNDNKDDGGGFGSAGTKGGAGSGDSGDVSRGSWSTGGQIPPVYANQGEVMPTMADFADMERRERERKERERERKEQEAATAGTRDILDMFSKGISAVSLVGNELAGKIAPPLAAINLGTSINQGTVTEDYIDPIVNAVNNYVVEPATDLYYKAMEKDYYGDDMIDPATNVPLPTSYGGAFDPSPGNTNPDYPSKPMTPQSDVISGNYAPPQVTMTSYKPSDPSTNFMEDLKTAFAEFNTQFEAEQEAKRQAAIDAANAATNAAYSSSTWSSGNDGGEKGHTPGFDMGEMQAANEAYGGGSYTGSGDSDAAGGRAW